jgi:SAM-dependent methyltransferase
VAVFDPDDAVILTRRAYEGSTAAAWGDRWADKSFLDHRFSRFRELLRAGARVLDLGCGPGLDARELEARGLRVTGLDLTRAMIDVAQRRSGIRNLAQGDSRRLPFARASFDGVWASASLLHLPKRQVDGALAEVRRVLVPSGIFYSAMKAGDHDGVMQPVPGHPVTSKRYFAHYRPSEWTTRLTDSGFEIVEQAVENQEAVLPDTPWIVTYTRRP